MLGFLGTISGDRETFRSSIIHAPVNPVEPGGRGLLASMMNYTQYPLRSNVSLIEFRKARLAEYHLSLFSSLTGTSDCSKRITCLDDELYAILPERQCETA